MNLIFYVNTHTVSKFKTYLNLKSKVKIKGAEKYCSFYYYSKQF